ncbi:MAG: FtsX-like permease family protein, partial [Armatimonadota bacterium]|nr:FtsX-like permease family protein [Armatimonadota bacterium]
PLRRAFLISLKSIKIRFWRSVITAAGIVLGIAFLVSVLAQLALQAPPTPTERVYPNVYARGEVAKSIDVQMEPGLTAKALIEKAGSYTTGADQKSVAIIKKNGDKVALDLSNPASPDYRLEGGDLVFIPSSSGRLRQLLVALIVMIFIVIGLVFFRKVDDKVKRTAASAAVVAVGIVIFSVGLSKSGLSPPKAPEVYVIERYHVRGETNVRTDLEAGKLQSLAVAIRRAGGFNKNADRNHILVIRNKGDKLTLDMSIPAGIRQAERIMLNAGDLVYVPDAAARNRQIWLVVMSLLVCTIGITNSMLMSVTERFKEIGTMKCLGALDKFVVELFLLESSMLGIAASFAGWLVGFGLMAAMAVATQGLGMLSQLSFMEVLRTLGIALVAGSTLTTIATIAPAIRASQMPPAAALRVEI